PQVALEGLPTGPLAVDIYRTSEVLVATPDLPLSAVADDGRGDGTRFHVGRYALHRSVTPSMRLAVTPNDAQFSADALVTIDGSPAEQTANVIVVGTVAEGVVDKIKLAASPEFQGPFVAGANAESAKASNTAGEFDRIIEIELDDPVPAGEGFVVRLSGVVSVKNDQRLRFPQLRVLNAMKQRVFLALPEPPKNQSAEWTRRGLKRQNLPASLKSAAGEAVRGSTYQADSDEYIAVQRVFPDSLRRATVRLATTRFLLNDGGAWSAQTTMIVQPGGGSNLSLKMPAGAELLHAEVDGQPILVRQAREGELMVPAGSRYLPRLITVAYRQTSEIEQSEFKYAPPAVLVDGQAVRIGRAFFQIEGASAGEWALVGEGALLDHTTFENAVRSEQFAAIREASPLAFQLPEWELKYWFAPWVRLLDVPSRGHANKAAEDDWAELREQINVLVGDEPTYEHDPPRGPTAFAAYYRGRPDGTLELQRTGGGFGASRWLLAIIISALTISAWRRPERLAPASHFLERWPAAIGVVVGVFWYAYLTPGLLGLAIIALSLAAMFKARQQRRWPGQEPQMSITIDGTSGVQMPSA
ncbi:MAG TPA: hypothetical protein VF175_10780, partial [Lacipirellula sp.]